MRPLPWLCIAFLGALLAGCGSPAPEPVRADIRGVVTSFARGGSHGAVATLHIEGGKQPDTRFDKAVVALTPSTRIYERVPSGRRPAALEALRLGDKVEVRFGGPVRGSSTVEAGADEILILLHLSLADRPAPETGDAYPAQFKGTQGPLEKPPPDRLPLTLRAVRSGPQEHFDRTVFELDADTIPGYRVEYIDRPAHCGSGLPAAVSGKAWLQVRLHPAQAHNAKGGTTVGALGRHVGLPVLREVQEVCDLQGDVTWILGLDERRGYRVLELTNPPRIVVDVAR